jgi:hypothetical protein
MQLELYNPICKDILMLLAFKEARKVANFLLQFLSHFCHNKFLSNYLIFKPIKTKITVKIGHFWHKIWGFKKYTPKLFQAKMLVGWKLLQFFVLARTSSDTLSFKPLDNFTNILWAHLRQYTFTKRSSNLKRKCKKGLRKTFVLTSCA